MSAVLQPNIHESAAIHASARVDPSSVVEEGAVIEAEAVVGPGCVIGARTRLRPRAMIVEHTRLGVENDVHPYAVLGGDPQDRAFTGEIRGELIIGDRNIFREGVTLSRGTNNGPPTRIGSGNFFMAGAHAGHNAQVGDRCVLVNGAVLAGHARVGNGCTLSAYALVHQFVNVGDLVMFQGGAGVSMHAPPFVILAHENEVVGLNRVGLQRDPAATPQDRLEVREVFRAVYRRRRGGPLEPVVTDLASRQWGPYARRFIEFIRESLASEPPRKRGIVPARRAAVRLGAAAGDS